MRNNCITGYLPFLLALLAISLLVVIACGGGDEPTEAPATAPLPTATQVPDGHTRGANGRSGPNLRSHGGANGRLAHDSTGRDRGPSADEHP